MPRLVMKFGGTSVADLERIRNVALKVKREVDRGYEVAVVVSAMSGETNKLVNWARELSPLHDAREYDTVVASGEQVTIGLLSIALQHIGVQARSWLGWQIPIHTTGMHGSAAITGIETKVLEERLAQGQVAVDTPTPECPRGAGDVTPGEQSRAARARRLVASDPGPADRAIAVVEDRQDDVPGPAGIAGNGGHHVAGRWVGRLGAALALVPPEIMPRHVVFSIVVG